jgi:hypothetical protein
MGEHSSYMSCPKCGGQAVEFFDSRSFLTSMTCWCCGYSRDEDGNESGGHGAYAVGKDRGTVGFAPLAEPGNPFDPSTPGEFDFQWYSVRRPDGRWEGVVVQGTATEDFPQGVIPLFQEEPQEGV